MWLCVCPHYQFSVTPGDDISETEWDVTIPAGEIGATFQSSVIVDDLAEADEMFELELTVLEEPYFAVLCATESSAAVVIEDDGMCGLHRFCAGLYSNKMSWSVRDGTLHTMHVQHCSISPHFAFILIDTIMMKYRWMHVTLIHKRRVSYSHTQNTLHTDQWSVVIEDGGMCALHQLCACTYSIILSSC